ncbi:MAG: DUF4912 domain-containing protein [Firmicutes bacterium]|nr:DUF4912 domain-containing protein [Bacillota bacterium]
MRIPLEIAELPEVYRENVLRLMVQGPRVIYAYWDLSPGHLRAAGEKPFVLYLYEEGRLVRKINLPPFTLSWYFRGVEPGSSYRCELGYEGEGGVFLPFLHSNPVNTPDLAPAEEPRREGEFAAEPGASGRGREEDLKTGEVIGTMAFYMGIYRAE